MRVIGLVAIFLLLLCESYKPEAQGGQVNLDTLWSKAQEFEKNNQPKSAAPVFDNIYRESLKAKDAPQALDALVHRIAAQAELADDPNGAAIAQLRQEMPALPEEARPLATTILAKWMWQYYESHLYEFADRAKAPEHDEDISTWDLQTLFEETTKLYEQALATAQKQPQAKLATWERVIKTSPAGLELRPTVFDFVGFEALEFFSQAAQSMPLLEETFHLNSASPAMGTAEAFLKADLKDLPPHSPKTRALLIFQQLLRLHQHDKDPSAFVDADLERLTFAKENCVDAECEPTLVKRLAQISKDYPKSATAARAQTKQAQIAARDQHYTEAVGLAQEVVNTFPDSAAATEAAQVLANVKRKEIGTQTEWLVPPSQGFPIKISYRNIPKVWFRVVAQDWKKLTVTKSFPSQKPDAPLQELLAQKPLKEWSVDLKPGEDYKPKTLITQGPHLPNGHYLLLASARQDFSYQENGLSLSALTVSPLSLTVRVVDSGIGGFVLNAETGLPVAKATVRAYNMVSGSLRQVGEAATDASGRFSLAVPKENPGSLYFEATAAGQSVSLPSDTYVGRYGRAMESNHKAFLFTDRALYRPGQTVRFKALALRQQGSKTAWQAASSEALEAELIDANGQRVAKQVIKTNRFGSASSAFTLPAVGLTGQFFIRITGSYPGSTGFAVEEYKRHKFEVAVEAPASPVLGKAVELTGQVRTFSGIGLGQTPGSYRVVRKTVLPFWWKIGQGFWLPLPTSEVEIAKGDFRTDAQGRFVIKFVVAPDPATPPKAEPLYEYVVTVDAADATGERNTAELSFSAAEATLQANINAQSWTTTEKPARFVLSAKGLDGKALPVTGSVFTIYRLKTPTQVKKKSLLENPEPGAEEHSTAQEWALWPTANVVFEQRLSANELTHSVDAKLPPGAYRAVLKLHDAQGHETHAEHSFVVVSPQAEHFPAPTTHFFSADTETPAGQHWRGVWGTGYASGYATAEIEKDGKVLRRMTSLPGHTQLLFDIPVTEDLRGGFTVRIFFMRDYRLYAEKVDVRVPWENKQLKVQTTVFRSTLRPGAHEKWGLKITKPGGSPAVAEVVATLYDAALDVFAPLQWPDLKQIWPTNSDNERLVNPNQVVLGRVFQTSWNAPVHAGKERVEYPTWRLPLSFASSRMLSFSDAMAKPSMQLESAPAMKGIRASAPPEEATKQTPTKRPPARKDFSETAFFFPDMTTNAKGEVSLQFQMPQTLTAWNFLALAHTSHMESGRFSARIVTTQELSVQPNAPRFVRAGDILEIPVRVANQTDTPLAGTAYLKIKNALTLEDITQKIVEGKPQTPMHIPPHGQLVQTWKLNIPNHFTQPLLFETGAHTPSFSDAEEGILPVLSSQVFVTDAFPFFVRGKGEHTFVYKDFAQNVASPKVQNVGMEFEFTANPMWYAVGALTTLMEPEWESSIDLFHKFYANALGQHIVTQNAALKRALQSWAALPRNSPLTENAERKGTTLAETPWVRDAAQEKERLRRTAALFEAKTLAAAQEASVKKLAQQQEADGAWSWFPGGPTSFPTTLHIVAGLAKLEQLKIPVDSTLARKGLAFLDKELAREFEQQKSAGDKSHAALTPARVAYLYVRSLLPHSGFAVPGAAEAHAEWLNAAKTEWTKVDTLLSQAQLALALHKNGDTATAEKILRSLAERAQTNPELGMSWPAYARNRGWWFEAPLETQALMIEAFATITHDMARVELLKQWLVSQKRTRAWANSKATAEAVHALVAFGAEPMSQTENKPIITLGGKDIHALADKECPDCAKVANPPGTTIVRVKPEQMSGQLANISVHKNSETLSWGSISWQYFTALENAKKTGEDLTVEREFLREKKGSREWIFAKGTLLTSERVRVRMTITALRDFEFIRLHDGRPAGWEPTDVLSGYTNAGGMWVYRATRDSATEFFVDFLPKGKHVFEYELVVQHPGEYRAGLAEIESVYAPEFRGRAPAELMRVSNSESARPK